jgi:predicted RNase H-like nuclease
VAVGTGIGVDGAPGGWVAVALDEGSWDCRLFGSFDALWVEYEGARRMLVDIPIGLPDDAPRTCDRETRDRLGPRGSSVFPVPTRAALACEDREAASAVNERLSGRRLSIQSWALAPKIREVDRLLRSEPRARKSVVEAHPELCLAELNGGDPMAHSKREPAGREERLAVLTDWYPESEAVYEHALDRFLRKEVSRDDAVDALALAVSGAVGGLASVPETPPTDAHGLPMRIVFPDP